MDELKRAIREYLVKEYLDEGVEFQIGNTTPLISGGIVDSFSMVSLKRFLEKKYAIRIPDADATPEAFDTVDRIAAVVARIRGDIVPA